MGLSSRQDVTSPNPHLTSPSPIPRPQNISTPALSTTFKPSSASFPSRNLNDNVGVTVIMPDGEKWTIWRSIVELFLFY